MREKKSINKTQRFDNCSYKCSKNKNTQLNTKVSNLMIMHRKLFSLILIENSKIFVGDLGFKIEAILGVYIDEQVMSVV